MMRRIGLFLIIVLSFPIAHAGYADGLISAGEYEYNVNWLTGALTVNGGGADWIEVKNSARLEVWSTNSPLGLDVGGIMDIVMDNFSTLNYYGGLTQELSMYKNATANLYGGRIDYLTSVQTVQWWYGDPVGHINIFCQPGWSWILDTTQKKVGITGLWMDNSAFTIHFTANGESHGYDPVWLNVEVITPEPATLLLLGLGGLLIRRKK